MNNEKIIEIETTLDGISVAIETITNNVGYIYHALSLLKRNEDDRPESVVLQEKEEPGCPQEDDYDRLESQVAELAALIKKKRR